MPLSARLQAVLCTMFTVEKQLRIHLLQIYFGHLIWFQEKTISFYSEF